MDENHVLTYLDADGAYWIVFNRPLQYNAISFEVYDTLFSGIDEAEADDSCKVLVFTGKGKYFTSGNDQNNLFNPEVDQPHRKNAFRSFIARLIDIKKPVIALVNGPAVGMGVTMLSHCDVVLASDQATFLTPFSRLALCAEGCSTYYFPRIMGKSFANEMLLFNKKATAEEMKAVGFISRVIPHDRFEEETQRFVKEACSVNVKSLMVSKSLINSPELIATLHEANRREVTELNQMMILPEALDAVMAFMQRKQKSKL